MSIISARFRLAITLLVAALVGVFAAVAMAVPASADPTPTSPYPPSLPSSSNGVGGVSSSRAPSVAPAGSGLAPSVAPAGSGLASTGVPTAEYVGVGLLLVIGGVVFVAAGRRGRRI